MSSGDNRRMTWTFPTIIIFLFVPLNMASSKDNTIRLNSALTCRIVRGLTREQRSICHEAPDTASVAFEGLQLAVKECQHQFRWHRWNCSSLILRSSNPHASALMKRASHTMEIYEHGGWKTTNRLPGGSAPEAAISCFVCDHDALSN
ncbi:unnamed protein product [Pieris macdunnoughi]|uniref:Protein Wnt n=1 Tax=Pieris macdunnoughi TaxID=345717 RepID=A0A821T7T4_9NEOP|nr:unnamed protein product [Pieris macdunnoughi]